jgi:hypothetical protein
VPLQKVDAARIAARQAAVLRGMCSQLNHAANYAIAKTPEIGMREFSESLAKLAKCNVSVFEKSIAGLIKRANAMDLNTSVLSRMSKEKQDIFFSALEEHVNPDSLKLVSIYHPDRMLNFYGPPAPFHEELTQRSIDVTASWNKVNPEFPVEMIMDWDNATQPFVNAFVQGDESFCNVKNFQFTALDPAAMTALAAHFPGGTVTKAEITDSHSSCLRIFTDALIKGGHAIDSVVWSANDEFESEDDIESRPCPAQAFSGVIKSEENTLVHLSLKHSFVSPEGVKALAEALSHEHCVLETLDLRNTPISSGDMLTVIRATGNAKNLKILDLRNCEFEDEFLDEFLDERNEAIATAKEKNPGLKVRSGWDHLGDECLDPPPRAGNLQ